MATEQLKTELEAIRKDFRREVSLIKKSLILTTGKKFTHAVKHATLEAYKEAKLVEILYSCKTLLWAIVIIVLIFGFVGIAMLMWLST